MLVPGYWLYGKNSGHGLMLFIEVSLAVDRGKSWNLPMKCVKLGEPPLNKLFNQPARASLPQVFAAFATSKGVIHLANTGIKRVKKIMSPRQRGRLTVSR